MAHTIQSKKKLLTRVRKIRGQVEALEKALDEERECMTVLQQIAAVRGATSGLMLEVLEGHVREHLAPGRLDAENFSDEVEQLVGVLRSYLK